MTAQRRERSLTIHHVTPHFYPEIGGLEESVRRLGVWFVRRGHRVVVHTSSLAVSGNTLPTLDSIDGIEIRRSAPIVRRGYFRTWFRPDLEGADLIHLHGYAVRTNDRVIRTDPGAPVVFSLHHGVRMVHRAASTRVLRAVYDRFVGLPTLRRVDSILVPSRGDVECRKSRIAASNGSRVIVFQRSESISSRRRFRTKRFLPAILRGRGPRLDREGLFCTWVESTQKKESISSSKRFRPCRRMFNWSMPGLMAGN